MIKFKLAIVGITLGVFLGAASHSFGIAFLSGTDILIHLILASVGGIIGYIAGNK